MASSVQRVALPPTAAGSVAPRPVQRALFCACGAPGPLRTALCPRCRRQHQHSRARFGGRREQALTRDQRRCRVCGAPGQNTVHHRRAGDHRLPLLVTLCPACHARLHRLRAMDRYLPPALVPLWQEWHPGVPVQAQLDFGGSEPEEEAYG